MGIESENPENESEGVVDPEVEIINALEELRKYKRLYKQLKTKVTEVEKKNNDTDRISVDLKTSFKKLKRLKTIWNSSSRKQS